VAVKLQSGLLLGIWNGPTCQVGIQDVILLAAVLQMGCSPTVFSSFRPYHWLLKFFPLSSIHQSEKKKLLDQINK
jgi:hypothetical protein